MPKPGCRPKERVLISKLKAILPVDVFGQPADLEPILNTAWKYKIKVIEEFLRSTWSKLQRKTSRNIG